MPDAAEVIRIHDSPVDAVQLHSPGAVTVMLLSLPVRKKCFPDGAIENSQDEPACVTVKVCPATVMVPVREAPAFASTA